MVNSHPSQVTLRILATSDLHMHMRSFNYITNCASHSGGLARVATMVENARAEVSDGVTLLLDNGDSLQGAALAYTLRGSAESHPLAAAFNLMEYDAIGLGNHDFDFGLDYLSRVVAQIDAPVIASNLSDSGLDALRPSAILTREVTCPDGRSRPLRIGVISVIPQQTLHWNYGEFPQDATIDDLQDSATRQALALKSNGADVVVLLAHSGIGGDDEHPKYENFALQLGKIKQIDAIVAGHTHAVFQSAGIDDAPGIDVSAATLFGTPAAAPGFVGSHLAQIDLQLQNDGDAWHVMGHRCDAIAANSAIAENPAVLGLTTAAHAQTLARLAQPIAQLPASVHSGFSLLKTGGEMELMAAAMRDTVRNCVKGSTAEELPILAAVAAFANGGRAAPHNYFRTSDGLITYRHLVQLCPYEDELWAVQVSGAQLRDWLERSAAIFNQLVPDNAAQSVVNCAAPRFNFDALFGLSYQVDPCQPSRFDLNGQLINPDACRIYNATIMGVPVQDNEQFLIASTNYRVAGGGRFPHLSADRVAVKTDVTALDALMNYLKQPIPEAPFGTEQWRVAPSTACSARFASAADAAQHLHIIDDWAPDVIGPNPNGFLQLQLHFR